WHRYSTMVRTKGNSTWLAVILLAARYWVMKAGCGSAHHSIYPQLYATRINWPGSWHTSTTRDTCTAGLLLRISWCNEVQMLRMILTMNLSCLPILAWPTLCDGSDRYNPCLCRLPQHRSS